jgi:hypothetical protein
MSFESGTSGPAFTLVICDVCGATEEYADGRVYAVADAATLRGWSIESTDHALCPDCDVAAVMATLPDDELELIMRDTEIDARVDAAGERVDP